MRAEDVWMSGHHGVLSDHCSSKRNKFNRDPQDWVDLAAAEARCGGMRCGGAMACSVYCELTIDAGRGCSGQGFHNGALSQR